MRLCYKCGLPSIQWHLEDAYALHNGFKGLCVPLQAAKTGQNINRLNILEGGRSYISHFSRFKRILHSFLTVSFWNFPGIRINIQSSIKYSICHIEHKYYTEEIQYGNYNCYNYPNGS